MTLDELKTENERLKKLLKLAVDDLGKIEQRVGASMCEAFGNCENCVYSEVYDNEGFYMNCEWKHADEAVKELRC